MYRGLLFYTRTLLPCSLTEAVSTDPVLVNLKTGFGTAVGLQWQLSVPVTFISTSLFNGAVTIIGIYILLTFFADGGQSSEP